MTVLIDLNSPAKRPSARPAAPQPEATATAGAAAPVRRSLAGLSRDGLREALAEIGVPDRELRMRAAQLFNWIYVRGAVSFDEMTTISKVLRAALAEHYTIDRPEVISEQISVDGTRKWLLRMPATGPHDRGAEIECVYIPEADRGTLCVSSQVGCTLTCTFCHTGTQRLVRNLSDAEIVGQVMVARDRLGDWSVPGPNKASKAVQHDDDAVPAGRLVTNIVLMGMGEPLYNFDNVKAAVDTMSDGDGIGLGKRRITLSTAGVAPMIGKAGAEIGAMLAISLHATTNEIRDSLVPLNKKYKIDEVLEACRNYPGLSNAKRITFEYVMLKGVNDSPTHARELVRLLKGIPAKINLIPFNPWPGTKYECSDWDTIEAFSEIVFRAGYASPVRTPRGRDIFAACGQLKSETEKLRARARLMLENGGDPAAEAAS